MVQFSSDGNKVTLGASRYRAEDGDAGKCNGCHMKQGFGCVLAEALYRADPSLPIGATRCSDYARVDGRSIVWVLDV